MSAGVIEVIPPPALPRKQRKPNYSILHYVTGNSGATAAAHYPENPYKRIYYEALDSFFNAIKEIFDQSTFKLFTQAKQLFMRAAGKRNVTEELKVLETHFKGDYDSNSLTSELPTTSNDLQM